VGFWHFPEGQKHDNQIELDTSGIFSTPLLFGQIGISVTSIALLTFFWAIAFSSFEKFKVKNG